MKLVFCILFHSVTDKSLTHRSYVSYILWLCSIIFVTYLMRIVSLIIPYTYSIFKRVMHIFMQQILRFLIMQEDINSPMSLFSFFSFFNGNSIHIAFLGCLPIFQVFFHLSFFYDQ